MAIKNTAYTYDSITAGQIIDQAYRYCGIVPAQIENERVSTAIFALNEILIKWANKGILQFNENSQVFKLETGRPSYKLPENIYDVINGDIATLTRHNDGTPFTSAGGTAANAFDDVLTTSCTQVSVNGSIGMTYADSVQIEYVGILSNIAAFYEFVVECSQDDINWVELYRTPAQLEFTATKDINNIKWFEILTPIKAIYFRIRGINNAVPLDISELYFMSFDKSLSMNAMSRSTYSSIPNKNQTGLSSSYIVNKNRGDFTVTLWPVPDLASTYTHVILRTQSMPTTVNYQRYPIDINIRFIGAIRSMLAGELALIYAPDKASLLIDLAEKAFMDAASTDADQGSFRIRLDMN